MKTIQIMTSKETIDRVQKTDGYFDATHFLKTYNQSVSFSESKQMGNFMKLESTKQFIDFLREKEGIEKPIKTSPKGTWMHPKIFIDFCMWISLEFKSKAIDWILDGLIYERNNAGDNYKELCSAIIDKHIEVYNCKPSPMVYVNEANALRHFSGVLDRNSANESQLKILNILQKVDIKLVLDNVGKNARYKQLQYLANALKF